MPWDQTFVSQHPKSIALIRAMRPRALKYATHHQTEGVEPAALPVAGKPPPKPTPKGK